jgi:flavin reductase
MFATNPQTDNPTFLPIDAGRFREMMRQPVSSVVIVATGSNGDRAGCTVTAVCSLSDSPPSLLICLNRNSSAHGAVLANRQFSINYLSDNQKETADVFAGRAGLYGDQKFVDEKWACTPGGLPYLEAALAIFNCEVASVTQFGSHSIICGTVSEAIFRGDARPLLYGNGRYLSLEAGA